MNVDRLIEELESYKTKTESLYLEDVRNNDVARSAVMYAARLFFTRPSPSSSGTRRRAMDLPEPRSDGKCVDCEKCWSETRDRRFCLHCLRKRIAHDNPIDPVFNDMRGRTCRSSQMLGGQPTTNDIEDE